MKLVDKSLFQKFEEAETESELRAIAASIEGAGYAQFSAFLYEFKERIKGFDDEQLEPMRRSIRKAERMIPRPGEISPSWRYIWDELYRMVQYKSEVFGAIPPHRRDGEWQVLLDNPFTHTEIVCYPGLSYLEGAYLYAYFRLDLKKNEYIRLQKIETVITYSESQEG